MLLFSRLYFFFVVLFIILCCQETIAQQKKYYDFSFKKKGFELFNFSIIKGFYGGLETKFNGMTYAYGDPVWGRLSPIHNSQKTLYIGGLKINFLTKQFTEQGYGTKFGIVASKKKGFSLLKKRKKNNQEKKMLIEKGYWSNGNLIAKNYSGYKAYLRQNDITDNRIGYEILPYFIQVRKGKKFEKKKTFAYSDSLGYGYIDTEYETIQKTEDVIVFKCATNYFKPIRLDVTLRATVLCPIHIQHTYNTSDIISDKNAILTGDTMILVIYPHAFQYQKYPLKNPNSSLQTHYLCLEGFMGIDDKKRKYCSRLASKNEFIRFNLEIIKLEGKPIEEYWGLKK